MVDTMIQYVEGDATSPQGEGVKIIAHVCNDLGGWGRGFVLSLSAKWKLPEETYRRLAKDGLHLGDVQFIPVEQNEQGVTTVIVANMIAQKGYGKNNKRLHKSDEENSDIPLQYGALERCLAKVAELAKLVNGSAHMPRIGCNLGGGSWSEVEEHINGTLTDEGISVTVYTRPGDTFNP
jgi:O-acetyl-ADP-ribose deacetylase (regulator of RNase III)